VKNQHEDGGRKLKKTTWWPSLILIKVSCYFRKS